jgi:hypothetical protein
MRPKEWQVSSPRYASFLVRVWCAQRQEAISSPEAWQGEVEHIQSSQRSTFHNLDELLSLLHQQLEEASSAERG